MERVHNYSRCTLGFRLMGDGRDTVRPLEHSYVPARITKEKTVKFAVVCIIIAVLGFFGSYLPFELLVNIVTPAVGYVGLLGWLFIIWRDIKLIKAWKDGKRLELPKE